MQIYFPHLDVFLCYDRKQNYVVFRKRNQITSDLAWQAWAKETDNDGTPCICYQISPDKILYLTYYLRNDLSDALLTLKPKSARGCFIHRGHVFLKHTNPQCIAVPTLTKINLPVVRDEYFTANPSFQRMPRPPSAIQRFVDTARRTLF